MDNYNGQHQEFDVRDMPPPRRHDEILKRFDAMKKGEGFVLVNDHDPKPLYYEIKTIRGEVFDWKYLENGPVVWKVNITKTAETDQGSSDLNPKLDVRTIPPRDRHPSIFHRFGTLPPGRHLEIINDHDPKPLYHHFLNTFGNVFHWEYLEQGPEVWRVKITKVESDTKESDTANIPKLDVRQFPPAKRHELIFEKFDNLRDGDSFELINDHDPIPLYYQLAAEYDGTIRWDYEETGPDEWRVVIGK